ncbi:MAG: Chemotaxis protein CheY [Candidatus Dichloromethanomonas elyunquensis]|nr:MAG: Chemotaxis protein CheY [Candidatus Dichloromethanomonas elyunquensis]
MAKILIVDDSLIVRMNLRKILTESGHEVVAEASNGEEACQKYAETKPELVTLDITMPKMDGIEALSTICQEDKKANVIMISALGQEAKILEALDKGAKQYIIKPFKNHEVLEKIDTVLKDIV